MWTELSLLVQSTEEGWAGGWVAFVLVFKPFCKQFYLWSANTVLIEVNEDWKCVAANICRSID